MGSYEQTLRLFERWCQEQMNINSVDKVTEAVVRKYINDLQERGKYTFYCNDKGKRTKKEDDGRTVIVLPSSFTSGSSCFL